MNICQNLWPHLYRKLPKGFPQDLAYILNRVGRIFWPKNFNVLWFQWKLISIFCFKRGPNRGEVYKRNICINYFLVSAHLSNSITSDNRDSNNALNSDMGVVWGLLCLHPNTIKPRYSLKLGGIMNCYFVEMMYGRPLQNFLVSCLLDNQYGHHRQLLFVIGQLKIYLKPFGQIN
jgi:hypothetical protein